MLDALPLRFLVAGAVNTAFGLATYAVFSVFGVATWAALLCGTIAGIGFNFVTLGGYAFRDLSWRRLPRFVCAYGVVYLVNLGTLRALEPLVGNAIWRQVLLTPFMALLSYFCLSRFVFQRGPTR
jgi:putative flippase GtrA